MWLEKVSQSSCDSTECPTCGGAVQRRVYGEMHAGSYVLDGKRVEIRAKPSELFADPIVLDPLSVYFNGGLYRLFPSCRYWTRGGNKLHRDVWESAFGPVPDDCHIHHRDNDIGNNALSNLECMDASEHLRLTWVQTKHKRPVGFNDLALRKATEWHRSEAGRLWHSRHAKRSKGWTKWKRVPKPCEYCGTIIQALVRKSGRSQKYCNEACKAGAYRERRAAI